MHEFANSEINCCTARKPSRRRFGLNPATEDRSGEGSECSATTPESLKPETPNLHLCSKAPQSSKVKPLEGGVAFLAQRMLEVVEETKLVLFLWRGACSILLREVGSFLQKRAPLCTEAVGYRTVGKEVQVSTRTPPNRYKNTPGPDIDLQSPNFENS